MDGLGAALGHVMTAVSTVVPVSNWRAFIPLTKPTITLLVVFAATWLGIHLAKGIAVSSQATTTADINTDSTIGVLGRQRQALRRLRGLSNSFASRAFTWGGGFGVRA